MTKASNSKCPRCKGKSKEVSEQQYAGMKGIFLCLVCEGTGKVTEPTTEELESPLAFQPATDYRRDMAVPNPFIGETHASKQSKVTESKPKGLGVKLREYRALEGQDGNVAVAIKGDDGSWEPMGVVNQSSKADNTNTRVSAANTGLTDNSVREAYEKGLEKLLNEARKAGLPVDWMIEQGRAARETLSNGDTSGEDTPPMSKELDQSDLQDTLNGILEAYWQKMLKFRMMIDIHPAQFAKIEIADQLLALIESEKKKAQIELLTKLHLELGAMTMYNQDDEAFIQDCDMVLEWKNKKLAELNQGETGKDE